MNKIAIIGISGSGKTTLSRRLAEKTHLPLFHMDRLFWRGNWQAVPEAEYWLQHQELLTNDKWIIEGYVDEKMSDRLQKADQIIYLDYPGIFCAWRLILRWLKHRKVSRPEMTKEALDEFLPKFWWMVLWRGERNDIELALKHIDRQKVMRTRSPRELEF
ncbi:TPA: hypothetical protein DCQ44_03685 [Candidatus Taylorbacteria bacterium]|nr:hypothetical protein [Candidatus Taylorbacteria bacterium]